ncbi:MAG: hypothetical protein ACQR33_01500 [Candidatus Saccharibacteria bacterium]
MVVGINIALCAVLVFISLIWYVVFLRGSSQRVAPDLGVNVDRLPTQSQLDRGILLSFWDIVAGGLAVIMIINQSDTGTMWFRWLAAGMIVRAGWLIPRFFKIEESIRRGIKPTPLLVIGGITRSLTGLTIAVQLMQYSLKLQHTGLQQQLHLLNVVMFWICVPLTLATIIAGIASVCKVRKDMTINVPFESIDRYLEGGSP